MSEAKAELQVQLVEAMSEFVACETTARIAKEKVVRLSRKLVLDPLLLDEEIVKRAGAEAIKAVGEAAARTR